MASTPTVLQRRGSGEPVPAELHDEISDEHLNQWRDTWKPVVLAARARRQQQGDQIAMKQIEDLHWEWDDKAAWSRQTLGLQGFALTADSELQGMMLLNLTKYSRLPNQVGRHIAYVEFLATAPWNRPEFVSDPQYRGVGLALIRAAIEVSRTELSRGRLGLHSLPRACAFYRDVCGMTDLGPDPDYQGLVYFEMTEAQANKFCEP